MVDAPFFLNLSIKEALRLAHIHTTYTVLCSLYALYFSMYNLFFVLFSAYKYVFLYFILILKNQKIARKQIGKYVFVHKCIYALMTCDLLKSPTQHGNYKMIFSLSLTFNIMVCKQGKNSTFIRVCKHSM